MAIVTCTEYRDSYKDSSGVVYPFPDEESRVNVQSAKTGALSSSAAWTLNSNTRWVRISTDTAVHYRCEKASATATTNDTVIPAGNVVDIPVGKTIKSIAVLAKS
jgi:hypothetical protein